MRISKRLDEKGERWKDERHASVADGGPEDEKLRASMMSPENDGGQAAAGSTAVAGEDLQKTQDSVDASARAEVELSEVVEEGQEAKEVVSELPLDLGEALRQKSAELAELQERHLRLAADFDNYRKRIAKERAEERKYAGEHLVRQLLDAFDNLERALAHAENAEKDVLLQGVSLVEESILQTLAKFGIKRFSAMGQPFDPAFHEAVQEVPSELPAGAVLFEVHKGYLYHDRLLRPARVVLSRGPEKANASSAAAPAENAVNVADDETGGD
jgi:molecular chaperone GrpE